MIRYHCAFRPGHSLEYGLEALDTGLHGIEIQSCRSYIPEEDYREYMNNVRFLLARGASLTIHAPIADINLGSTNRSMRRLSIDHILEAAKLASELGASAVVVHAGMGVLTMPAGSWSAETFDDFYRAHQSILDEVHGLVVDSLREIADTYPKVIFGLENLVYPHELYRFPQEMLDLVTRVERFNVGMTLDIGHGATVGQCPVEFLDKVKDKLVHIHVHDNHGVWDEHLPLGQGAIDYPDFFAALACSGYKRAIAFEFSLPNPRDFRYMLPKISTGSA